VVSSSKISDEFSTDILPEQGKQGGHVNSDILGVTLSGL
jgi:hypothetical protein